jgi:outer membrane protein assembly factor BamB
VESKTEAELWVICPVCHKANPANLRFCQHCWGAVLSQDTPLTADELEEVNRRKEEYLRHRAKRRKRIKLSVISFASLVFMVAVFLILYNFTDVIRIPPQGINSDSSPGEWAMFRHDLVRSGSAGTAAVPQGTLKWSFPTDAAVHSSPAVVDGTVYFGSQDYNLYALDAETGTEKWEYKTGSWVESSPAIVDGVVYCGSNDSMLYALDARTGERIWNFKTIYPVRCSPAVADGVVYCGSDDYYLYAIDAAEGTEVWDQYTGSPVVSSPVVANGIVYIGSGGGYSYAINALNGQFRLRFKTHYAVYSSPVVIDETVYFATDNGLLYAVDGMARTWLWEHDIRPVWTQAWAMMPILPQPPVESGLLWSLRLGRGMTSSPVVTGDTMYIGLDNKLIAVDLQSREVIWEFATGGTVRSSPALVGSTIFVGSEDGKLYAVDAATGEKLWDFLTGDKITSSPAVVDGVVYVGSHDGNLYAIE